MVSKSFDVGHFFKEFRKTYFGNPVATRDLRVQLRGNRSVVLFSIYLIIMTFILLLAYDGAMTGGGFNGGRSLSRAQDSLQSFYYTTQGCLAAIVVLVAPAIGSFAVVLEKQRRSIDLIFTAPVEPRTYFVGKLLSTYRFVWLLLILSLPFCAVSVTLGGVTWAQLFVTFLLYSFFGMVCVSIGLLISTVCEKLTQALIYTYIAVGAYVFFITFLMLQGMALRGGTSNVEPLYTMHPVVFGTLADTKSSVGPITLPGWVMSIILQLLIVKFFILAAGTSLSPADSKNPLKLRIYGLLYLGAIFYLFGQVNEALCRGFSGARTMGSTGILSMDVLSGRYLASMLLVFNLIFTPFLSTFGNDGLKRLRFDGIFNLKNVFRPVPSGSIPYILCMQFVCILAFIFGAMNGKSSPALFGMAAGTFSFSWSTVLNQSFLEYVIMAITFALMTHALGFFGSSKRHIVSQGRTAALLSSLLILLIPAFVLFGYASAWGKLPSIWYLTQVGSISDSVSTHVPIFWSIAHVIITILLHRLSLRRIQIPPAQFQIPSKSI
jgi:ABC-type transport system involved in cytochrome c biogenesis permease component